MATYVFVRVEHISKLVEIIALPTSRHPQFSLFRHSGSIVRIADRQLEALRTIEKREVPKAKRPTFAIGSHVKIPEGPFTGLTGIVERSDGRYTLVAFGGALNIEIETFQLREDAVEDPQRAVLTAGTAASAA